MIHKKTLASLIIIGSMSTYYNTKCMNENFDRARTEQTEAKKTFFEKKAETETSKQQYMQNLYTEKTAKQKAATQKFLSDIEQNGTLRKLEDGAIAALRDGVSGTISNTGTYYFKKKIDLYLDGSLTTAELLNELTAREDFLQKRLLFITNDYQNKLARAKAREDDDEIDDLKEELKRKTESIDLELDENWRLYTTHVSGKRKS